MMIRENRIYGEKMAAGFTISEGHSETSVPFRSPLTVVLGRSSMPVNEVRSKMMVENEDDLRAITVGTTEVMKIFSDRYETLTERKNRFTPFKDNNMSGPIAWGREHEGLERQLAKIDKKYKYHSESSPGSNTDSFFEKIQELPEALRQAQEEPVVVHTINTRLQKEEMGGEMGEHIRSRRYRKETTDEFREAHNKRVSDFNEYNNRSSLASSFPKTQSRTENSRFMQEQEEKQDSKFSGRSHRERDEDSFHKRPKPMRNPTDQAIIDWRLQTAIDSRMASESVPSIRETNTEIGRKKKWQKEEDRESRWSSGVKKTASTKHVRNTTDINVADTKSAKITLRRLLQETALSKAKDANPPGNEVLERPASRRRKIRKKCSELLASRSYNSEHGDNKTSKIPHVKLVPKMSKISIQGNVRIDEIRAHQKEWSPVRPAKKRSLRVCTSEVTSVVNDSSRGEVRRKTSEFKPEMFGKGIGHQRRKKQSGDEILSFESVLKMKAENQKDSVGTSTLPNHVEEGARRRFVPRRLRRKRPLGDEVLSFESVMKMKSENKNDSIASPNPGERNAELGNKPKTVEQNKSLENQISKDEEQEEIDDSRRDGLVMNSGTPLSVIVKESRRKNSDKNEDGKNLLRERSRRRKQRKASFSDDNAMVLMTGRQNKEQVKDPVVMTQTEEVGPSDVQPDTPTNGVSNNKQLSKEIVQNSSGKNNLQEKKTNEDENSSLSPHKNVLNYSEIWKHE